MKYCAFLFLIAAVFASCAPVQNHIEYTIEDVSFVFEGPLYSGPNTAQAALTVDIQDILDSLNMSLTNVTKVELKSAELYTDSLPIEGIQSFVIQFTSEQASMIQAGVLNPVPVSNRISMQPSAEANLADIFREKDLIALLDADIVEDADTSFVIYGSFTFLLELK